jgi:hypothetical protein
VVKVFISYANQDLTIAESLFDELVAAGADVFQFGQTERSGKPSWDQVLSWISESDVFVVLISQSSLRSRPVKEEIEQAHYSYVNRDKPSRLISLIIENSAKPPVTIERFATIDLIVYEAGITRLMKQLELKRRKSPAPISSKRGSLLGTLPDLSEIFADYKKTNPEPNEASLWSKKAEKIVLNYNAFKPKEISQEHKAEHIDKILAEYSGKATPPKHDDLLLEYDNMFYKLQPKVGKPTRLSQFLLDPSKPARPLEPPKLSLFVNRLSWDTVTGASAYVLEESYDANFLFPKEVFRGQETSYWIKIFQIAEPLIQTSKKRHFRVKATGLLWDDSPWSNVVQEQGPVKIASLLLTALPAPELSNSYAVGGTTLTWSKIDHASSYVLERSTDPFFFDAEVIYEGEETSRSDFGVFLTTMMRPAYYRVKARGAGPFSSDSSWSNVVKIGISR